MNLKPLGDQGAILKVVNFNIQAEDWRQRVKWNFWSMEQFFYGVSAISVYLRNETFAVLYEKYSLVRRKSRATRAK